MQNYGQAVRGALGLRPLDEAGHKKAAEVCFVVSALFIVPLVFFSESLGKIIPVVAQVLWVLTVWRGLVMLNRREKQQKGQGSR